MSRRTRYRFYGLFAVALREQSRATTMAGLVSDDVGWGDAYKPVLCPAQGEPATHAECITALTEEQNRKLKALRGELETLSYVVTTRPSGLVLASNVDSIGYGETCGADRFRVALGLEVRRPEEPA